MTSSNSVPCPKYRTTASKQLVETEYKGRLTVVASKQSGPRSSTCADGTGEYEPVDFDGWFPDFAPTYGEGWGETTGGVDFLGKANNGFHQQSRRNRIAQACPDAPVALIGLKPDAIFHYWLWYPYERWRSVLMEYDSKGAALSGKHGEFWDVSMSKVER